MLDEGNGIFLGAVLEPLRGVENVKETEECLVSRHHWSSQTLRAWRERPMSDQAKIRQSCLFWGLPKA